MKTVALSPEKPTARPLLINAHPHGSISEAIRLSQIGTEIALYTLLLGLMVHACTKQQWVSALPQYQTVGVAARRRSHFPLGDGSERKR